MREETEMACKHNIRKVLNMKETRCELCGEMFETTAEHRRLMKRKERADAIAALARELAKREKASAN
jgi:hypothetical protein